MSQNSYSKDDVFNLLFIAVGSGNINKTKEILNTHSKLADLSDPEINEDGILFGIAMKKSAPMLKLLVDTYVQTNLQGDPHSIEYLVKKVKLENMLEAQIDSSQYEFKELPEEVQAILRPWIPKDEGSDRGEQDLSASYDVLEKGDNTHHGDTDYIDEQPAPEYNNGCLREAVLGRDSSGDDNAHSFSPEVY